MSLYHHFPSEDMGERAPYHQRLEELHREWDDLNAETALLLQTPQHSAKQKVHLRLAAIDERLSQIRAEIRSLKSNS